jgi:hypothetical protein
LNRSTGLTVSGLLERSNPFEGFEEMRREMEREFEENLKDIEDKVPKDLVREYVTEDGAKVR